jgi:predicted adenylyl cyclase CyaB
MSQVTEVEMRGPLPSSQVQELRSQLEKLGTFIKRKERVLIDYSTFLPDQGIEKRTVDIRLRNTNKESEIIVKTGAWGGSDVRKEYSVVTQGSFDTLVQIYKLLGLTKGVLCVRNSDVYRVGDVEIAIVEVPGHSYFFEAELESEQLTNITEAQMKLASVLESLNLKSFTDTEYFAYIEQLNREANTVFDATIESETYFRDTFKI